MWVLGTECGPLQQSNCSLHNSATSSALLSYKHFNALRVQWKFYWYETKKRYNQPQWKLWELGKGYVPFGRFQLGIPSSTFQEQREGQEGRGPSIQSGVSRHRACGNSGPHLGQRKSCQEMEARVCSCSLAQVNTSQGTWGSKFWQSIFNEGGWLKFLPRAEFLITQVLNKMCVNKRM